MQNSQLIICYRSLILLLAIFSPVKAIAQSPNLNELIDVKSTDWAFQALVSLNATHNCLPSFSNDRFQGDRPITRLEFAQALNLCLDRLQPNLPQSQKYLSQSELEKITQLQQTFSTELKILSEKANLIETKTTTLEKQQFSTTTKLYGQIILGLQTRSNNAADLAPRDGRRDTQDPATQTTFGYNTQLSLATQFTPRSFLLLGLQSGNLSTAANNNNLPYFLNDTYTRLAYESNTDNNLRLSDATLRLLPTDRLAVIVGAIGVNPVSVFRGPNRYEGAGSGPLSAFAQRNPILNLGGQAGLGVDWQIDRNLSLQALYSAGNPADTTATNGLFDGANTVAVQLAARPTPTIDWTAYYLRNYSTNASLGTGIGDDLIGFVNSRFTTNAIGTTLSWRIHPKLTLGGWIGHTQSQVQVPDYSGSVNTFNWMSFINLPDLLGPGNLGGIYFGQPPKITASDLLFNNLTPLNIPGTISGRNGISGGQPGTTYHIEAFYRWQTTPNLSITPGFIWLINPVQTNSSDNIWIGTIRSTFTF
jgi:hypothetical protein